MKPRVENIELPALEKTYAIRYLQANLSPGTVNFVAPAAGTTLIVQCRDPLDPPRRALKDALCEWLRAKAREHITPLLSQLAQEHGFPPPSGVRIAFQKSRWGSRSTTGVVSFSALMMFFPPDLLRHVVLHELCHIRHMNHGMAYQTLLKQTDPKTPLYEMQLKKAGVFMPDWIK